ncbi:recombinase [Eubacterium sp.]|uniref:recombinase n=1 Tax=Eubacterium sp. TaxID=142586 RepID=UPI0026DEB4CB|nr:recombinase [Eubacterium sp.]MDO5431793.1 recombinase [Eubacterium sp.]
MTAHIPYGYRIEDGKAVVDESQAEQVRAFFKEYISGKALMVAAETVGLKLFHGSAGRMLRNTHYLGDDYYPAIIDRELFDKAEEQRQARAGQLGRVRELTPATSPAVPLHFTMGKQKKVCYDPFEQAEYAYSLIESEVEINGTD